MRGTYVTALIIAAVIIAWLLSGLDSDGAAEPPTLAQANQQRAAEAQDQAPARVRARVIHAQPQLRHVVLRGRTENKRTVEIKAETAGRIVERPAERGAQVNAGDLLCRISEDDRGAGLEEARAALHQARIEHDASLKLQERGFQSETAIAQAAARLAAAQAQVERRALDLQRTYVRAPFAGVVEDVHLEVGDYVTTGGACTTIVDMNPMLLVGRVSEREVAGLKPDQLVTGVLSDGRSVQGPITFIGQRSDTATRTYAVEVEVPNPHYDLRSGITTEIRIPVAEVMAHRISPALLALDDAGNIGVRTIDHNNRVQYHQVEIIRDDALGAWVTGLPEVTTLITVGQELVVPGQEVEISFEPAAEMPAQAPDGNRPSSSAATPADRAMVTGAALVTGAAMATVGTP
ncbi:MAG: efflux RND transporter periplasmic adaptor subunit [Pseudomonadales bacterium]